MPETAKADKRQKCAVRRAPVSIPVLLDRVNQRREYAAEDSYKVNFIHLAFSSLWNVPVNDNFSLAEDNFPASVLQKNLVKFSLRGRGKYV